jgi:hypothetical protein
VNVSEQYIKTLELNKMNIEKRKKSNAAHKVLSLMDKDFSYEKALRKVLKSDKRLNKVKLEKELDFYI